MMKSRSLLLSLLLIALALKPYSVAAESDLEPVLDIDGNNLRSGVYYYIVPIGRGGGLTLANTSGNETCPLDVVQEQFDTFHGLPLTFTPVNPKEGVIRVSTDHNIKFSGATTCVQSTVWKLEYDESSGSKWFVITGGVEGNPGCETLGNWFKIQKQRIFYKLVFCPTVCNLCKPDCANVGIYIQDGYWRLALSDAPFWFRFKKA